jgi:hypothetical protein
VGERRWRGSDQLGWRLARNVRAVGGTCSRWKKPGKRENRRNNKRRIMILVDVDVELRGCI